MRVKEEQFAKKMKGDAVNKGVLPDGVGGSSVLCSRKSRDWGGLEQSRRTCVGENVRGAEGDAEGIAQVFLLDYGEDSNCVFSGCPTIVSASSSRG